MPNPAVLHVYATFTGRLFWSDMKNTHKKKRHLSGGFPRRKQCGRLNSARLLLCI